MRRMRRKERGFRVSAPKSRAKNVTIQKPKTCIIFCHIFSSRLPFPLVRALCVCLFISMLSGESEVRERLRTTNVSCQNEKRKVWVFDRRELELYTDRLSELRAYAFMSEKIEFVGNNTTYETNRYFLVQRENSSKTLPLFSCLTLFLLTTWYQCVHCSGKWIDFDLISFYHMITRLCCVCVRFCSLGIFVRLFAILCLVHWFCSSSHSRNICRLTRRDLFEFTCDSNDSIPLPPHTIHTETETHTQILVSQYPRKWASPRKWSSFVCCRIKWNHRRTNPNERSSVTESIKWAHEQRATQREKEREN